MKSSALGVIWNHGLLDPSRTLFSGPMRRLNDLLVWKGVKMARIRILGSYLKASVTSLKSKGLKELCGVLKQVCAPTRVWKTAHRQALLSLTLSLPVSYLCHHRRTALTDMMTLYLLELSWRGTEKTHLEILLNSQALSEHLSVSEPNFWYKMH